MRCNLAPGAGVSVRCRMCAPHLAASRLLRLAKRYVFKYTQFVCGKRHVGAIAMRIFFALALCAWREDWPPAADSVRTAIRYLYGDLIPRGAPFTCRHPPHGPEELRCYTNTTMSTFDCLHLKEDVADMKLHTVLIDSDIRTNEPFSLCRLELYCGRRTTHERVEYE